MNPRTRPVAVALTAFLLLVPNVAADEFPPLPEDPQTMPTTGSFAGWVNLADRYRADWERAASGLTPDRQSAAIRLADELFGGTWGGYWLRWDGLPQVSGQHFNSRSPVRRAPAEIVEPARSYLLWHIAAVRAETARKNLGDSQAQDPEFWEVFNRCVPHGIHFDILKERAARVLPRLMAEASLGFALFQEGTFNIAAAFGMLTSARWELERALDRFQRGEAEPGMFLVTDAVASLRHARTHGISPGRVRAMLAERFGDHLASVEPVVTYGGRQLSFRETLHDGIAYWKTKAARKPGVDVGPLSALFQDQRSDGAVEQTAQLEERVLVTAEAVNLNVEGYLFRELETLVDDAAEHPVLPRYADLDMLGRLLLFALLQESAKPREYEHVRSSCAAWLLDERGVSVSEAALTREMIGMGSRILVVPGVADDLGRTQRGTKLLNLLSGLDSPGLHAHIGNLWSVRALSLPEGPEPAAELIRLVDRVEAFRAAETAYLEAQSRYRPDRAPAVLQSLAQACRHETLADTERVLAIAGERGLHDVQALGKFLGGTAVEAETWTARLERLIGRKQLDGDSPARLTPAD